MDSRFRNMPTTSVRRRISLFSRSCGLLDQVCRQASRAKAAKAGMSSGASSSHVHAGTRPARQARP
jgi:hypothetical protein